MGNSRLVCLPSGSQDSPGRGRRYIFVSLETRDPFAMLLSVRRCFEFVAFLVHGQFLGSMYANAVFVARFDASHFFYCLLPLPTNIAALIIVYLMRCVSREPSVTQE